MATEGTTVTININTNIVVDSIFLNAVDETAVLNGNHRFIIIVSMQLYFDVYQLHTADYSFPTIQAAFPTGGNVIHITH
jgi:hypothetical protein